MRLVKLKDDGNTKHVIDVADISVVTSWYDQPRHKLEIVMKSGTCIVVAHSHIGDADSAYAQVMQAWTEFLGVEP